MELIGGGLLMQITQCLSCGADDQPIQGAALPYRGGMLVGWFCAPCVERIAAEERARQECESAQASKGE